jgi:DNA-binding PadR family transcriptional regulator
MEELEQQGYRVRPGTLYPLLHGLERGGMLISTRERLEGCYRRTYRITPKGKEALQIARRKVQELFHELFEEEETQEG